MHSLEKTLRSACNGYSISSFACCQARRTIGRRNAIDIDTWRADILITPPGQNLILFLIWRGTNKLLWNIFITFGYVRNCISESGKVMSTIRFVVVLSIFPLTNCQSNFRQGLRSATAYCLRKVLTGAFDAHFTQVMIMKTHFIYYFFQTFSRYANFHCYSFVIHEFRPVPDYTGLRQYKGFSMPWNKLRWAMFIFWDFCTLSQ